MFAFSIFTFQFLTDIIGEIPSEMCLSYKRLSRSVLLQSQEVYIVLLAFWMHSLVFRRGLVELVELNDNRSSSYGVKGIFTTPPPFPLKKSRAYLTNRHVLQNLMWVWGGVTPQTSFEQNKYALLARRHTSHNPLLFSAKAYKRQLLYCTCAEFV
jgi:hypothetical protein